MESCYKLSNKIVLSSFINVEHEIPFVFSKTFITSGKPQSEVKRA